MRRFCLIALCAAAAWPAAAADAVWPEFRGPAGNGLAPAEADPPVSWSETEHIAWKTPIPHQGWSTPAALDGRIWLTTATEDGHDFYVIAVDAASGAIVHNVHLFHADAPEPLGNNVNCYASPSPCAEPGRVYVHFGSYGTACLDAATAKPIWTRRDLPCRHYRGPGSSPILFEDLLVLTFDGVDVQYVAALDKTSGETRWKTDRTTDWPDIGADGEPLREGDFRKAFTTPLVVPAEAGPQIVSPASYAAYAYDARTGQELWHTVNKAYSPAPRPVYGHGLVFITTGRGLSELWAIKPTGRGDVTDSHVVWRAKGPAVPEEPSPLLVDGRLYLLSNRGIVTCFDALSGEEVWQERLGGNYMASPIHAAGRLYFASVQGKTTVMQAGAAPKVLAENRLDDGFMASPAVLGDALILRTKTHLYRIDKP